LPSIDVIDADTDIIAFLQSGVPAELTRAALRRAWTSDPAIRDFIGIAENQWDFNDPNGIPGFGPLGTSEDPVARLSQASRSLRKMPDLLARERGVPSRETQMSFNPRNRLPINVLAVELVNRILPVCHPTTSARYIMWKQRTSASDDATHPVAVGVTAASCRDSAARRRSWRMRPLVVEV